ncbi:MAG: amidohydrolase [Sporolactobacillus sp.]
MSEDYTDFEQLLISRRRKLHEHPETAFEEFETTRLLKEWLSEAGVELAELPLKTGVLAVIRGNRPGPVIALRSDIDALPVQEQTGLPFASKVPGKMHACGHDFHMAAVLGATLLLNKRKSELQGTVKVIFQPAEEFGNGAREVIKTGVLDEVDAFFGMHDMPYLPTGTVAINSGAMMAAVDHFTIDVEGTGSHAAEPQKGIDAVVMASHIVTAMQSIVARNLSPLSSAVLSITRLQSGNTWNVLPQTAELEGTVRTFDESVRDLIPEKMEKIAKNIAEAFGGKAELHYDKQGPALINTPALADIARTVAEKAGLKAIETEPSFAGEDFADYVKNKPGMFCFVGVSGTAALHNPHLIIDEKAILPSAKFFADLAVEMLRHVGN